MAGLLEAKEYIKNFYSKYEIYVKPVLKFLLALISFILINSMMGYMQAISGFAIPLMAALFCSFLPWSVAVLFAAGFMLAHFYALALECAVVALAVFFLIFLLYFRFTPKDGLVVLLLPLLFGLRIPYLIPVALGLLASPVSMISCTCGVIVYYLMKFASDNMTLLTGVNAENTSQRFRLMIDGLMDNKAMMITIISFAITILVVYMIRRMSMDHAWTIAIIAGILTNAVILLVGELIFDLHLSILGILLGSLISGCLAKVVQFLSLNLDYSRTERVQFEDDDYYYYVKAVPKIVMAPQEKKVKKIHTQRKTTTAAPKQPTTIKTSNGVSRTRIVEQDEEETWDSI